MHQPIEKSVLNFKDFRIANFLLALNPKKWLACNLSLQSQYYPASS